MNAPKRAFLWLLVLAALLPVGCAKTAKDKLVGKWQGSPVLDDAAIQRKLGDVGGGPVMKLAVETGIEAAKTVKMDIQFNADGTMNSSGRVGQSNGTWQVLKAEGPKATLKTVESDGKEREMEITFENDDTFSMPLPAPLADIGIVRFQRVKG
jgi:hypothetical protein